MAPEGRIAQLEQAVDAIIEAAREPQQTAHAEAVQRLRDTNIGQDLRLKDGGYKDLRLKDGSDG